MISIPRFINSEEITNKEFKEGDLVQLYNGTDSVWTCIVDVKTRGYFDGVVSSRLPVKETAYNFGDLIRFHGRHIYNISKSDSLQYS